MQFKSILMRCIPIGVCIGVYFFIQQHVHELTQLKTISFGHVFSLLVASFFYLLLQGAILNKALKIYAIELSFKEWFGLIAVTLLGNYIIPFSGLGFRAKYLKDKHKLDYKEFSISLAAIFLIELFIFVFGGLISMIYLYYFEYQISLFLIFLMFGFLIVLTCLLFYPLQLPHFNSKFIRKIDTVLTNWHIIKKNRSVLKDLYLYTVLLYLVSAMMFYVAYDAIHLDVNFYAVLLPTTLADLAFILRIAPGSLGTYDASIVYSSLILGYTIAQGVMVIALIRIATLLWIVVCGPISSFLLFGFKSTNKSLYHDI